MLEDYFDQQEQNSEAAVGSRGDSYSRSIAKGSVCVQVAVESCSWT